MSWPLVLLVGCTSTVAPSSVQPASTGDTSTPPSVEPPVEPSVVPLPPLIGWSTSSSPTSDWSVSQLVWWHQQPTQFATHDNGDLALLDASTGAVLDTPATATLGARLSVSDSGLHLAYVDPSTSELIYAKGPAPWTREVIATAVTGNYPIHLDVAEVSSVPWVLFYHGGHDVLRLARRNTAWSHEDIPPLIGPYLATRLADGGDGKLHVGYVTDGPSSSLGYHRQVEDYTIGGGLGLLWDPEAIAVAVDEEHHPDLIMGAEALPCHWFDGSVNIAASNPTTSGAGCLSPTLQIDLEGRPHTAYISQGSLRYARWNLAAESWDERVVVDASNDAVVSASMLLDATLRPHFSYVLSSGALVYGHYAPE